MQDLEFLRYLIDLIDHKNGGTGELKSDLPSSIIVPSSHIEPKPIDHESSLTADLVDVTSGDKHHSDECDVDPRAVLSPMDDEETFIPPLQQRIEMLKKLTGVNPKDREILAHIDADDPTAS